MSENNRAIVKSSTALTRFDPKARKELVIRGLISLDEDRDADFYFFKGESHRIKEELKQAIYNYEKALNIDPKHEESLFFLGHCYFTVKIPSDNLELDSSIRNNRAAEALQKLIDIREKKFNPLWEYYLVYCNLGLVQFRLGLYEKAIVNFKKAIELNPEDAGSYYGFGNAQYKLNLYAEAIENYEKALELKPEYANSYHMLGRAQCDLGSYEEAIGNYEKAIKLKPEPTDNFYYRLGNSQRYLGSYEEAIENYEKAVKLEPEEAYSYQMLGISQSNLGLYEKAVENFEKAIRLKPEVAYSYYGLCNAQYNLGSHEEALENFEEALELELESELNALQYIFMELKPVGKPAGTLSYFMLGLWAEKIDREHKALEYFEKFLSRDSDKENGFVEHAKRRVKELKASVILKQKCVI